MKHVDIEARLVVRRDPDSGLWHWQLVSAGGGPIARSASGFASRELLLDSVRRIRAEAPRSLVFDPMGTLYEGV